MAFRVEPRDAQHGNFRRQPRGTVRSSSAGCRPFIAINRPSGATRWPALCSTSTRLPTARTITASYFGSSRSSARTATALAFVMPSCSMASFTKRIFFCVPSMSMNSGPGTRPRAAARGNRRQCPRRGWFGVQQVRHDRQAVEHVQREDAFGGHDGGEVHVFVALTQQKAETPELVDLSVVERRL